MYRSAAEIDLWLLKSARTTEATERPASTSPHHAWPPVAGQTSCTKRAFDMATPPVSAPERSSSPKKRKLDPTSSKDIDTSSSTPFANPPVDRVDLDSTRRSNWSRVLSNIPLHVATFPPPASASFVTSVTSTANTNPSSDLRTRTSRGRSGSPVKNIISLQRLDKPIHFGSLDDNAEEGQLPGDARDLFVKIWETLYSQDIYPAEVQDEIQRLNRKVPAYCFRKAESRPWDSCGQNEPGGAVSEHEAALHDPFFDFLPIWALPLAASHSSTTPVRLARAEFHHVRHIQAVARECLNLRRSEASWNCSVHEPLLALALWKYRNDVAFENASSATILPAFTPTLVTGEAVEAVKGKIVDLVLSPKLVPGDHGPFMSQTSHTDADIDSAIQDMLATQPSAGSSDLGVNQTDYLPLLRAPIAVTIKTMVSGASPEEGRIQLGIWTAAWHARMAALGVGGGKDGPLLPTIPLILTHEHVWSLYFAADRGHRIEILGSLRIGMTDTVQGIYKLLAVLRLLAEWIKTEFRRWVIAAFVAPRTTDIP